MQHHPSSPLPFIVKCLKYVSCSLCIHCPLQTQFLDLAGVSKTGGQDLREKRSTKWQGFQKQIKSKGVQSERTVNREGAREREQIQEHGQAGFPERAGPAGGAFYNTFTNDKRRGFLESSKMLFLFPRPSFLTLCSYLSQPLLTIGHS